MWIYARPDIPLPVTEADVAEINPLFDQAYSWRVPLR
jgi:hypothetical protein